MVIDKKDKSSYFNKEEVTETLTGSSDGKPSKNKEVGSDAPANIQSKNLIKSLRLERL